MLDLFNSLDREKATTVLCVLKDRTSSIHSPQQPRDVYWLVVDFESPDERVRFNISTMLSVI